MPYQEVEQFRPKTFYQIVLYAVLVHCWIEVVLLSHKLTSILCE
jgi:hypothetical protein